MIVVPISFGTWLTFIVVGFAILGLILLPSWLETWAKRSWQKRTLKSKPQTERFTLNWRPDEDHR